MAAIKASLDLHASVEQIGNGFVLRVGDDSQYCHYQFQIARTISLLLERQVDEFCEQFKEAPIEVEVAVAEAPIAKAPEEF